eukprot:2219563-Rhodomonas_salina.2
MPQHLSTGRTAAGATYYHATKLRVSYAPKRLPLLVPRYARKTIWWLIPYRTYAKPRIGQPYCLRACYGITYSMTYATYYGPGALSRSSMPLSLAYGISYGITYGMRYGITYGMTYAITYGMTYTTYYGPGALYCDLRCP